MRILFFAVGDFKEGNGANSRFVCYGKGLKKRNVPNKFYFILPSEFNDNGINTVSEGNHEGVDFEYLSKTTKRRKSLIGRLFVLINSWRSALKLISTLDKKNDLLYFYGPQALILGPIILAAKLRGFATVVENTEFQTIRNEGSNWLVKQLNRAVSAFFEYRLHHVADKVIVISKRLLRLYRRRFPDTDVHLVPIVVDPDRFKDVSTKKPSFMMGYLGSFGEKDGVPGIIQAFQSARKSFPHLRLRLIGYQIRSAGLSKALEKYSLRPDDPNLEITGQVKSSDIPGLLAECDLLLLNRINTPYANYGFATKLGEYMATGRPVISTDISDVSFYLKDREHIRVISPNKAEVLAEAIVERYNNYEEYDKMGQNGKEKAIELFAYQRHVDHIISVCGDALGIEHKKVDSNQEIDFLLGERPGSNRRPLDPQTSALTN